MYTLCKFFVISPALYFQLHCKFYVSTCCENFISESTFLLFIRRVNTVVFLEYFSSRSCFCFQT